MPVNKVYKNLAFAIVIVSTLFAVIGLIRELTTGLPLDLLMRNLENWATDVGFRLILIVLAAAGVQYLTAKK
ncbi:MAG TPA: hypothetical protein VLG47_07555 [Candidatus Saccharimonadales bacterium]|nr:hypothetical protein [Candidatus Saccharimonadales bacterium]